MADDHGLRSGLGLLMSANKITVKALCKEAGVHPAAVTRLRKNHFTQLDAGTLEKICRCLKVDIGEILYFDPPITGDDS